MRGCGAQRVDRASRWRSTRCVGLKSVVCPRPKQPALRCCREAQGRRHSLNSLYLQKMVTIPVCFLSLPLASSLAGQTREARLGISTGSFLLRILCDSPFFSSPEPFSLQVLSVLKNLSNLPPFFLPHCQPQFYFILFWGWGGEVIRFIYFIVMEVLKIGPRTSCTVGMHSTTELYRLPRSFIFLKRDS